MEDACGRQGAARVVVAALWAGEKQSAGGGQRTAMITAEARAVEAAVADAPGAFAPAGCVAGRFRRRFSTTRACPAPPSSLPYPCSPNRVHNRLRTPSTQLSLPV